MSSIPPRADAGRVPVTIERLVSVILAWRWIFLGCATLSAAAIIAWAFYATPVYRVSIKVMPRHAEGGGGQLQSLIGQFGGLASMAGVGLGASVDEQEALAYLKSRSLFETFMDREQLMPVLFAPAWDPGTKNWRRDLKRIPTRNDAWMLFDRQIRNVSEDTKSRLVTLEVTWKDGQSAARWANDLVRLANEELRSRALTEADASLESLREQLAQADALELRLSIYQLMQAQIDRKVLAKARPDYALAVLDPAVVPDPDKFSSPRRGLLIVIALPFGVFAGSCAAWALQIASSLFAKRARPS